VRSRHRDNRKTDEKDRNLKRTNTPTGSKFTVRGQVYIQTGSFYHDMGGGREVRVLELDTKCPECGNCFQATASMRQISTRQLVRRCPARRKIHFGPVAAPPRTKPPGRKIGRVRRRAERHRARAVVD